MADKVFTGRLQLIELEPRIAPSAVLGAISEGFLAFGAFADSLNDDLDADEGVGDFDGFDLDAELADLGGLDAGSAIEPLLMAEIDGGDAFPEFDAAVQVDLLDLDLEGSEVPLELSVDLEPVAMEVAPDVQAEVLVNSEEPEIDVDTPVDTE